MKGSTGPVLFQCHWRRALHTTPAVRGRHVQPTVARGPGAGLVWPEGIGRAAAQSAQKVRVAEARQDPRRCHRLCCGAPAAALRRRPG
eukprot:scaffold15422_cov107-Isochrysis_galbana.AAC.8